MKNKKKLGYVVSCVCVLAILVGLLAVASSATESIVKYNYMDLAGVGSNTYTCQKWSRVGTDAIDAKALAALGTEGAGIEHTFGLTVDSTATASYGDLSVIAFVPKFETMSGAATRGYGVKLLLNLNAGAYHFYPNYVQGKNGTADGYCGGTIGYDKAPGTPGRLQVKAYGNFSDSLKAKLQGNGETIKITIGFKVHDIADNGDVTVEYYLNLDGVHTASIYTLINKETSYYKNQDTTAAYTNAYTTIQGGGLIAYSASGVTVGGAAANSNNYKVSLSDIRPTTLVPEVETNKGTMLINGQTGNVTVNGSTTVTVSPKAGYDVAGLMVGSKFIHAPASVKGTYTFNIVPSEVGNTTVKPMFVTIADMLDYGTAGSVTSTKNNKHIVTANNDASNSNEAAHNTEFKMNVTFNEGQPKMIQIGAFLQEAKAAGSNYNGAASTWDSNPYTPEYGFMVKMSHQVIYLCTMYGRTVDDVIRDAPLDVSYTNGDTSGYGWAKWVYGDNYLKEGQTIELGLGEIQLDQNNIIYYIRMNGEVVLSVPVDLSKVLNLTSTDGRVVVNSKNHVGNRVAFTSGDTASVTVSTNKTQVDNDSIDFTNLAGTLPAGQFASVPEQYYLTQGGNRVTTVVGGNSYTLEAAITEATPKLGQNISLYYTAKVKTSYGTPVLSYVYEGQTKEITGTSLGEKYGYTTYEFVVDIFPQDMDENIFATLKAGDVELCELSSFSMQSYCRTLLDKIAAGKVADNGLKRLLVSVLYYGDAAQKYFDGVQTPNCTAVLTRAEKAIYVASANGAKSVQEGANVEGFTWKEATLLLQERPVVRFFFDSEWKDVTVKVTFDGKEYSYGEENIKNWGTSWYFDFDELKPTDLGKQIKVTVYKSGQEIGAYVTYSANTYIYNQKNTEGLGAILAALYTYGVAAENYYGK